MFLKKNVRALKFIINLQHRCKYKMLQPDELLKTYHLSHTHVRSEIIRILMDSALALSMAEIKERFRMGCDRVTLYRNLKTFTKKGIIHQIFIDNQDSKYVLPENIKKPEMEYTEHPHFKCVRCNSVRCLNELSIGSLNLPQGFRKLETNFVVFGLCNECNN